MTRGEPDARRRARPVRRAGTGRPASESRQGVLSSTQPMPACSLTVLYSVRTRASSASSAPGSRMVSRCGHSVLMCPKKPLSLTASRTGRRASSTVMGTVPSAVIASRERLQDPPIRQTALEVGFDSGDRYPRTGEHRLAAEQPRRRSTWPTSCPTLGRTDRGSRAAPGQPLKGREQERNRTHRPLRLATLATMALLGGAPCRS